MSLELRREEWDTKVDFDNIGMKVSGEAITANAINQRVLSVFTLDGLNSTDKCLRFIINIHCKICYIICPLFQLKCAPMCSLILSTGILKSRTLLQYLVQSKC